MWREVSTRLRRVGGPELPKIELRSVFQVGESLGVSELRCPIAQNEAYIFMFRPSAETGGRPP